MKTKLFFTLCFIATLASCNKDPLPDNGQINVTPTDFQEYFGNEITRSFLGNVVDANNNPIENVLISIGSTQVQTDDNGVFIIENAQVNERFAYIKAKKTGYIHGSRSLTPTSGVNKVTIMLLEETIAGSTSSGTEETISISNGASVSLKGNYIKEDGSAYSGNLDVIIHHLDPTNEATNLQMPGMLYAENTEGQERMLQTLGMLAVELKGNAGEDLNLAEGSTAEIKIPVDASLLSTAPSTIPLWYFDEDKGYWIEEGQATLVGNFYIGTVTHFSFWNCDIPAEAINLCVTIINDSEIPFANTRVSITSATYGTRSGYTNDTGEVCGLIPRNETLEINVYEYDICGNNAIYTASIGPYTNDDNLSITITETSNIISETVTGTFNDCSENPITDGYVVLTYGNQKFFDLVTEGTFEINMLRCSSFNNFTIEAVDTDNLQTTGEINYTFATPQTQLGDLISCDAITEFIQYTIDDDSDESVLIATNINANFNTDGTSGANYNLTISGQGNANNTPNRCFYLFGALNSTPYTGTYDNLDFQAQNDTGLNISECLGISQTNNNITYNVTALGDAGEYIDINFSGSYEDYDGNAHTITGVIHVIRD